RGNEQQEVGPRHEPLRQLLMTLDDGVRARRVYERDVSEQGGRVCPVDDAGALLPLRGLLAVRDDRDAVSGGRDAFRHHVLPQQGVEEARLAGVELARYDDHEQTAEVVQRGAHVRDVLIVRPEATEKHLEVGDGLPLASCQLAELLGYLQHRRKIPLRLGTPSWPQHGAVRLPGMRGLDALTEVDLERFCEVNRVAATLHRLSVPTSTVADAAAAVGTDTGRIVKSLVFLADGEPVLAVAAGEGRVTYPLLA